MIGAWAAIESRRNHPGNPGDRQEGRVVAASRLAACSWPRAGITALSYKHLPRDPDTDPLTEQFVRFRGDRTRSAVIADSLINGQTLALRRAEDQTRNNG